MYAEEDLKVLLGNSIPLPEMDYDDEDVNSETGYPVEEMALREYYFITITGYMAHPDFKEQYLSVITKIRQYSTEEQQLLAYSIVQKMPEKYDFEFSLNFTPDTQEDINELLQCIEFIEFAHSKFIESVWKYLKPDLNSLQFEKYCEQNNLKILSEIESQLESRYFPELITDFLRTYNKENLIEWFCEKSKVLNISIRIALQEEKTNG